jgi:hypothetical protein
VPITVVDVRKDEFDESVLFDIVNDEYVGSDGLMSDLEVVTA